jgi:Flagellar assembly protein FliH
MCYGLPSMDLPEPLRAGFALAATIAGDKGAQCAARGLHPSLRSALTALPEALAALDKTDRRERVRVLVERLAARARTTGSIPTPAPTAHTAPSPTPSPVGVIRVVRGQESHDTPVLDDTAIASALRALSAAQTEQRAESERAGLQVGLRIAAHIVGRALELRPDDIVHVVSPLLARVRRASSIQLRMHPDDAAVVDRALPALTDAQAIDARIEIIADPTLQRGDCVLESNLGEIDARVESRLESLGSALKGAQL